MHICEMHTIIGLQDISARPWQLAAPVDTQSRAHKYAHFARYDVNCYVVEYIKISPWCTKHFNRNEVNEV